MLNLHHNLYEVQLASQTAWFLNLREDCDIVSKPCWSSATTHYNLVPIEHVIKNDSQIAQKQIRSGTHWSLTSMRFNVPIACSMQICELDWM